MNLDYLDAKRFQALTVPDPANYPGSVSSGDDTSLPFIAANDAFPWFYSETGLKSVKHFINRFDVQFGVAGRTVQPGTTSTSKYTDVEVDLIDYDAKMTINPYVFEKYWDDFKYTGRLVMPDLAPLVNTQVVGSFSAKSGEFVGQAVWQGDTGLGLEGIVQKGIDYVGAGTDGNIDTSTEVTGAAGAYEADPIAELNKLKDAVIATKAPVYASPSFKYLMSYSNSSLYEQAQQEQNGKGPLVSDAGFATFAAKEVIPLFGMPNDVIIATHCGSGPTSNLRLMTGDLTDPETLVMDRLANDSREFFILLTVKLGVEIVRPDEYFYYTVN